MTGWEIWRCIASYSRDYLLTRPSTDRWGSEPFEFRYSGATVCARPLYCSLLFYFSTVFSLLLFYCVTAFVLYVLLLRCLFTVCLSAFHSFVLPFFLSVCLSLLSSVFFSVFLLFGHLTCLYLLVVVQSFVIAAFVGVRQGGSDAV